MTNSIPPDIKPLQPYYQDQEIDLVDIWLVLYRRRALFFSIVAVVVGIASVFIAFMHPIYESRAVIQIGHVGGIGANGGGTPIELPGVLLERLNEEYRVNDTSEGARGFPLIANVALNKAQPDIVTITARAPTVDAARNYLATVVAQVQQEHDQLWREVTSQQHARLDLITERIQRMRQQIQSLNETRSALKSSNPAQLAMLMQERGKLIIELPILEEEQTALTLSVSRLQTQPTRLLRQPTSPTLPERPRPLLYMSLALFISIMLGIISVFMVEFITNARRRLRTPTPS